jgi:hypothetical protein
MTNRRFLLARGRAARLGTRSHAAESPGRLGAIARGNARSGSVEPRHAKIARRDALERFATRRGAPVERRGENRDLLGELRVARVG